MIPTRNKMVTPIVRALNSDGNTYTYTCTEAFSLFLYSYLVNAFGVLPTKRVTLPCRTYFGTKLFLLYLKLVRTNDISSTLRNNSIILVKQICVHDTLFPSNIAVIGSPPPVQLIIALSCSEPFLTNKHFTLEVIPITTILTIMEDFNNIGILMLKSTSSEMLSNISYYGSHSMVRGIFLLLDNSSQFVDSTGENIYKEKIRRLDLLNCNRYGNEAGQEVRSTHGVPSISLDLEHLNMPHWLPGLQLTTNQTQTQSNRMMDDGMSQVTIKNNAV